MRRLLKKMTALTLTAGLLAAAAPSRALAAGGQGRIIKPATGPVTGAQFRQIVSIHLSKFLRLPPAAGLEQLQTIAALPAAAGSELIADQAAARTLLALMTTPAVSTLGKSPAVREQLVLNLGAENVVAIETLARRLQDAASADRKLDRLMGQLQKQFAPPEAGLADIALALNKLFDGAGSVASSGIVIVSEDSGKNVPSQARLKKASSADPEAVRLEYSLFLSKLGFRDYPAEIDSNLKSDKQTPLQKQVLEYNRDRYQVFNAARDLAADVIAGLAEQGFSKASLDNATELAARLLSLQPLDSPSTLPPEVAKKDEAGITEWLVSVTVQRISSQLASVVSDVVKTTFGPKSLARFSASEDIGPVQRVSRIKGWVERLLIAAYTDGEIGQTRYAGRALAAALTRYSRLQGKPAVEAALKKKLRERGLYLENFIGDMLSLEDASGKTVSLKIKTGDFIGERSGGREAAEITFAVRPALPLWFKAWRQNLFGGILGLWANPKSAPSLAAGQPIRNRLKLSVWKFKGWLADRRFLKRGYSHIGMASVEESDGIAMVWAMDNYPNAQEGGIRKIGLTEQFSQNGPYLRLGVARFDADKVWDAFAAQAAKNGYTPTVYESEGGRWPSSISPEEHAALARIPKSDSKRLLAELNARAVAVLETMMVRQGVGFATGFVNEIWRAYCSLTMVLAHRMGSQFEIQSAPDRWHPFILLLKHLGIGDAKDQDTSGRIIWPGSLFVDPKIESHVNVRFPAFAEVGRLPDAATMPAYLELDRDLTRKLSTLLSLSDEGSIEPDPDVISAAVRAHLDSRAEKRRSKSGLRSGASHSSGYSAGLDALLRAGDGE